MLPFQIFLSGLIFLVFFSFLDIARKEIDNFLIICMLGWGLFYSGMQGQIIPALIGVIIFFWFGYLLWTKKTIGGADSKIIAVLPSYFAAVGFPNMFVKLWVFIMLLLVVGILYLFAFKLLFKKEVKKTKGKIPFIPAITICYILLWMINVN